MALPAEFQFNQSNLQDFVTCPRRFELRYVRQLSWPAIQSEPVREAERLAQRGSDFHRLVHQHLIGLDEALLTGSLAEAAPDLQAWWQNYLDHRPAELAEARTWPELTLSVSRRGHRLSARFDLLAASPGGEMALFDWKTSPRKPTHDNLAGRIQTRVYPYVLVAAGTAVNDGRPIDPAAVKMVYWYPQDPRRPEVFDYSPKLFRRDEQFLDELIERVKHAAQTADFPMTVDPKPCAYCVYRSYCDRGDRAGPVQEAEEPPDDPDVSALDWDQIAEIQY